MAETGDPIGTGLVASLPRPGGNVTGIASVAAELAGKSVQFIRDMLPSARRVTALANATDRFRLFLTHADKQPRHPRHRSGQARRHGVKPRPLRSLRWHGWISQGDPGKAQAETAALYRRRRMLLFTSVHRGADAAQFWRSR